MKMRKAAAVAFHAADCDQALCSASLAGHRKVFDFEVGQAVYFWRRGAGSTKKTRQSYWAGPGRVAMTSLLNAVWVAYNSLQVKASPERVRHASSEENLSVSGWLRGMSQTRREFEKIPQKGFLDLSDDPAGDPGPPDLPEGVDEEDAPAGPREPPSAEYHYVGFDKRLHNLQIVENLPVKTPKSPKKPMELQAPNEPPREDDSEPLDSKTYFRQDSSTPTTTSSSTTNPLWRSRLPM